MREDDLVRVAGARHQAEAEFVQGLLLEEGIPSMLRRARGFDVPDMLAAGPRDVLVRRSRAVEAREVLMHNGLVPVAEGEAQAPDGPGRVLLVVLAMVAAMAIIVVLASLL